MSSSLSHFPSRSVANVANEHVKSSVSANTLSAVNIESVSVRSGSEESVGASVTVALRMSALLKERSSMTTEDDQEDGVIGELNHGCSRTWI